MTEVSELKLKLVGMEKEQREQEEKQRKAEVSVIYQILGGGGWDTYCSKLRAGEAGLMWTQAIWSTPSLAARSVYAQETQWSVNTKLSGFAVAANFSCAQTTQFWL